MSRQQPTTPNDSFHNSYKRNARKNFTVEQFLDKKAIDYPGQREGSQQTKVLTKTMLDLFYEFHAFHPNQKVSLTTFKRRRPNHVALSSSRKFLQCLCEKCTNVMLLMSVLNPFLKKKSDDKALTEKVTNADDLVQKTVCENVTRACLKRECERCGIDNFISSVKMQISEHLSEQREWKRWEKSERSKKDLVRKKNPVIDIVDMLSMDLNGLAKHIKVAQWQRHQYQMFSRGVPKGHVVLTVDFAENYLCKYQDEIQSAHWSYRQVSVHPCVFFFPCSESDCSKVDTEYVVFLSDDIKHDASFTKHVFDHCIQYAKSKNAVSLHIYSDGCGSQYKSKTTFFHLTQLQRKHSDIKITRHFFGSNHGKSLCDSCGGVVKNSATRAVSSGEFEIQSAREMLDFCNQKLKVTAGNDCSHTKRSRTFQLVNSSDLKVDRSESLDHLIPVKGTLNIHSLKPSQEIGKLEVSELSCYCSICMLGEEGECPNRDYTNGWRMVNVCQEKTKKRSCKERKRKLIQQKSSVTASKLSILFSEEPLEQSNCCEKAPGAVSDLISSNTPLSRQDFFKEIQDIFSSSKSFDELKLAASCLTDKINLFHLPSVTQRCLMDVGIIDSIAHNLLSISGGHFSYHRDEQSLSSFFPVLTQADGNCVPRALSLIFFGDQDHHVEIRCRIAHEMVLNCFDYLSGDPEDMSLLCQLSDCFSDSAAETFKLETLSVCKNSQYMGMWQLMAATNVFNTPIRSVYPSLGPKAYIDFSNRILHPRNPCALASHIPCLMWSSTRTCDKTNLSEMSPHWTANHVVPLMPLSLPTQLEVVIA